MKTSTKTAAIKLAIERLERSITAPIGMKQIHVTAALMGLRAAIAPIHSAARTKGFSARFCAVCKLARPLCAKRAEHKFIEEGSFEAREFRRSQFALALVDDVEEDTKVDQDPAGALS